MADASGRDLTQFFRWYEQAGTPEVVGRGQLRRARHRLQADVAQTMPPTPASASRSRC